MELHSVDKDGRGLKCICIVDVGWDGESGAVRERNRGTLEGRKRERDEKLIFYV